MTLLIYIICAFVFSICFIAYHMYIAPEMDENTGRIIKPGKKLSDLWRKQS
jgi:hypothetical protein